MILDYEHAPLYSEAGESAVLGTMLLSPEAIDAASEVAISEFYLDSNRTILSSIRNMHGLGLHVDGLTVMEELRRQGKLDSIGGPAYLAYLTEGVWRSYDVRPYLRIIREKAQLRRAIALCESIRSRALLGEDSASLLTALQSAAAEQQGDDLELRPTPIAEIVPGFLDTLRLHRESPDELRGISTGIPDLDAITSGWREGELSYIGALPGRGKTAFMVQQMHTAAMAGAAVGFISLEMTKQQILSRLATIHTGLHPTRFRNAATMSDHEWKHARHLSQSAGGLGDLPIEIYDRSGLRAGEVAAVARRMHANGCKIVFVDFIQRIRTEGKDPRDSINRISSILTETCKALQVPFVVASQLARRDSNPNRRPTMQDLRESGNLEQDAHNVMLLFRPQESARDNGGQELPPEWTGRDEVIVAKQREGLVGSADVTFHEKSLTFQPRSPFPRTA